MPKIINHCKYLHLIYTTNLSNPLFHTTRHPIFPNSVYGEKCINPDNCLREAKTPTEDVDTLVLAGDPKSSDQIEGIKPEIMKKWDQRSKPNVIREWSKLSAFY